MDRLAELSDSVARTVRVYCDRVDAEAPDLVMGLYLVGSVALGDYREGLSDVDFLALVPAEPDAGHLDRLARVHGAMAALGPPAFDGVYVTPERLTRIPGAIEHATYCVEGEFRPAARCFEVNPVVWTCLARHGIPIRGREPAQLGIAIDPDALRRLQIANLDSYWRSWIGEAEAVLARKRPDETMSAASFGEGVLGVARIARTVATGDIVSKTEAGHWALRTYGTEWRSVIADALRARDGHRPPMSRDRFARCIAFMRFAIARAQGLDLS